MQSGLFAHAASRWGSRQGENLATSALVYLLNTYDSAATEFHAVLGQLVNDPRFERKLRFVEQLVGDSGRIDAAGLGQQHEHRVLIECKFDATLGDTQISGYLSELSTPGILLFLVPRNRRREILNQVATVLGLEQLEFIETDGFLSCRTGSGAEVVAVADWHTVLDIFDGSCSDVGFLAEAAQLRSYVDRMTGDGFTPLTAEELSGRVGTRWRQFVDLITEAIDKAEDAIPEFEGDGQLAAGRGSVGRYLRIGPLRMWAGVWTGPWSDTADTPLWLQFKGAARLSVNEARMALAGYEGEGFGPVFERNGEVLVPLYLRCAADRDEVVRGLVDQLAAVVRAVGSATAAEETATSLDDVPHAGGPAC
jgi:hypothetical protein